jgi:hypothetical protein
MKKNGFRWLCLGVTIPNNTGIYRLSSTRAQYVLGGR